MKEHISAWQALQRTFREEILANHQTPVEMVDQFFSEVEEVEELVGNSYGEPYNDEVFKKRMIEELADVAIISLGLIDALGGDATGQMYENIKNQFAKYAPFRRYLEWGLTPTDAKREVRGQYPFGSNVDYRRLTEPKEL